MELAWASRADNKPEQRVVKRSSAQKKQWTITSLITLIPLFLFASLFSTTLCPPSTAEPSSFSRAALSSIGLAKSPAQHSELHRTLCYPSNLYHQEVLVPYVYPALENAKARLQAHPVYVNNVEPGVRAVKASADRVWNGPVKPVVSRLSRGAQKVHLTYVQPHVPFVKAKFTEATAPLTLRVQAFNKQHVAPRWLIVKKYICAIVKQAKTVYRQVIGHPLSKIAHHHSQRAYKIGKHHSYRAYIASRPHAIRAWNEGRRHTRDTVIPRAVQAYQLVSNQVARIWLIICGNVADVYNKHAAKHVDPYVHKANAVIAPYSKIINEKVYRPYIFPLIASIIPIPEKPKTFWGMISDFLPSPGATNVGERGSSFYNDEKKPVTEKAKKVVKEAIKGKETVKPKEDIKAKVQAAKDKVTDSVKSQAEAVKEKVVPAASSASASVSKEAKKATKAAGTAASQTTSLKQATETVKASAESIKQKATASVKSAGSAVSEEVSSATSNVASQASTASASISSGVDEAVIKADLDKKIATFKKQVDFQGKAIYARVQAEAVKNAERYIELMPEMRRMGNENLHREINRMVGGLDKLYTNSKSLTTKQVDESQRMSDVKVKKALKQVTDGLKTNQNNIYKKTEPAVEQAKKDMEGLLNEEYESLGKQLSLIESASQKDWSLYHSIKKGEWRRGRYLTTDVETWQSKFPEAPTKTTTKQLKDVIHRVEVAAAEVQNEFNEIYQQWTERQTELKRTALGRIEARRVMAEEGKQAQANIPQAKAKSADSGRASILPVTDNAENAEAVADGNPIIGKPKEQIVEALKQAESIAKESSASFSKSAEPQVSIQPVEGQDPAAAREGTPIIGKAKEQVEEALKQASAAGASVTRAAKEEL